MNLKLLTVTFILFLQIIYNILAQTGIKGTIFSSDGKVLPYATIYIQELKTGTVANIDGYYEYPLKAGSYHIEYRHLGYVSQSKFINVVSSFVITNVHLKARSLQLEEVQIVSTYEDPAYAIMRKAIAAARYYRMLVKSFDANVYIKGSGEFKVPEIIHMIAKSKGLDTAEYFVSESFSKIHYEYPSTYEQSVFSARTNEQDSGMTMVNNFINASIYEPTFAGVVSPLSPAAFSYYRFKLLGIFQEKEETILQIEVIPRSKGTGVFSGSIYIIKHKWNVYSIDLKTWIQGFEVKINQMFAQVNEMMWFPVNQQFDIKGKILGVDFAYKYLTSMSEYHVALNDSLKYDQLVLIDEKTEKEYAMAVQEERQRKKTVSQDTSNQVMDVAGEAKFTLKDFRNQMKEYEKEAERKREEPEVVDNYSMIIDSLAFSKNRDFWDSIRPIPLTENEKRPGLGKKIDSIAATKENDTTKGKDIFGDFIGSLIFGSDIKISKSLKFIYPSPLARLNFNTAEGFNLEMPLKLNYRMKKKGSLEFGPVFRYGFTDKVLKTSGGIKYILPGKYRNKSFISVEGGTSVSQLNEVKPILPVVNSISSLFWVNNHMKIYQKDFIALSLRKTLKDKLKIAASTEWAERTALYNKTSYTWVAKKGREYTSNAPENIEDCSTVFDKHRAFTLKLNLDYTPVVKYRKFNNEKIPLSGSYPLLSLGYRTGLPGIMNSNTDYHLIESAIFHRFEILRNQLDLHIFAGGFLKRDNLYFTDYRHFQGNLTSLAISDPMNTYQLLDYYNFSTARNYTGGLARFSFNRFMLTRIFWLNITGVTEHLMVHYLKTSYSPQYIEFGYGLNNFARLFRIEAYTAFEDGKYKQFGIRLGLSGMIQFE